MAKVDTSARQVVFGIRRWLGVNENPDGDTGLQAGEAAVMRNWRVTADGHLKLRPGSRTLLTLGTGPLRGLWSGRVAGQRCLLAAAGGKLYQIHVETETATQLGTLTDADTHFFGFSNRVYLLNGSEYLVWDGETLGAVEPYVPLVATATPPEGGGTLLEAVNRLTGKKRQRFSPTGSARSFQLAETGIDEVVSVLLQGQAQAADAWSADLAAGTVTLDAAPAKGTNTLEICWRKGAGDAASVTQQRFSETYNGATDTRVFLYGDGTNRAIYSGINEQGQPDAGYFPALGEVLVDSSNTPITAMVKHFDKLLAFKSDGLWALEYGTLTLADGSVTAAFYTIPINREIGNTAPGQVRLVDNWPRTVFGRSLYTWRTSGAIRDERTAERFSQRVETTLAALPLEQARLFDDEARAELYLFCASTGVVYNYGTDVFYIYDGLPVRCAAALDGALYFGTADGRLLHFDERYRNDDGTDLDAYWESGSMAFDRQWQRKCAARLRIVLKPVSGARVTVKLESDRSSDGTEQVVSAALMTFLHMSFAHFAFGTNRKPQVERAKVKLRKFVFGKLILRSCSASATATVLGADLEVIYGGKA